MAHSNASVEARSDSPRDIVNQVPLDVPDYELPLSLLTPEPSLGVADRPTAKRDFLQPLHIQRNPASGTFSSHGCGTELSTGFCMSGAYVPHNDRQETTPLVLWRTREDIEATDSSGKTIIHLAVEAADIEFLEQICEPLSRIEPGTLRGIGSDRNGHTVYHTATSLNDRSLFEFLLAHDAPLPVPESGRPNLLDLAILTGSETISELLIDQNLVPGPHTACMHRAIRSRQERIARLLLPSLKPLQWTTAAEIGTLSNLAHDNGMHSLADDILATHFQYCGAQDTVQGLDKLEKFLEALKSDIDQPERSAFGNQAI